MHFFSQGAEVGFGVARSVCLSGFRAICFCNCNVVNNSIFQNVATYTRQTRLGMDFCFNKSNKLYMNKVFFHIHNQSKLYAMKERQWFYVLLIYLRIFHTYERFER